MQGMPRRYFDYLPQFHMGHLLSSIGAFVLAIGLVLMIYNFFRAAKNGAQAPQNPWKGRTLEWQIPSPPPLENFEKIPVITEAPYEFD
jgi:cytochrome c oxidase subunit 1